MRESLLPAEVKELQLATKRALASLQRGMFRSKRKGQGTDFDQLRDYQLGDDVRFIDWRGSARVNKLLIRQQLQENSPHILIAVDISPSMKFGATESKWYLAQKIGVILATAAFYSQSSCSLLFFDDQVRAFYPAMKGMQGLGNVVESIIHTQPGRVPSHFGSAFAQIATHIRKDMLVCILSDLIEHDTLHALSHLHQRAEVVIVRCLDFLEEQIANMGLLQIKDIETNQEMILDTKELHSYILTERITAQNEFFQKQHIDCFDAKTGNFTLPALVHFFNKRLVKR
jgi:uncharacterized protein (DUF58 family)